MHSTSLLSTSVFTRAWPEALCHCFRQAEKAELVEVHDHTRWAAPQIGLFGPPADPPLGPQAPAARQGSRQGHCLWCKATDHVIGQCPLNEYASEHFPPAPKQKAAAKQQGMLNMS